MSYRLVTLSDAKSQLAYDDSAHDAELTFRLEAVSGAIMNYLSSAWARTRQFSGDASDEEIAAADRAFGDWTDSSGTVLTDSSGDPATDSSGASVVPGAVRAAVICALAAWDEDRTVDLITPAVRSLLTQYRNPTVT